MRGFHSSLFAAQALLGLQRVRRECFQSEGPRSLVGSTCPLTKNKFVECLGYNYFSSRIEVTRYGKPEH